MTKRLLRRMAYQSDRRPELALVLHDALLEVYPREYEAAIRKAESLATDMGNLVRRFSPYYVVFLPSRLPAVRTRLHGSPFMVYSGWAGSGQPDRGPRELTRVVREISRVDPYAVATYSTSRHHPIGGRA